MQRRALWLFRQEVAIGGARLAIASLWLGRIGRGPERREVENKQGCVQPPKGMKSASHQEAALWRYEHLCCQEATVVAEPGNPLRGADVSDQDRVPQARRRKQATVRGDLRRKLQK